MCPALTDDLGMTIVRPRSRPHDAAFIRLTDGREVQLASPIVLGRNPMQEDGTQTVAVADPEFSVSKTHLRLDRDDEAVWVTDLQSTNGARVILPDGSESWLRPSERTRLWPGARVCFGTQSFTLVLPSAPTAPATPTAAPAPLPAEPASTPLIAAVPTASDPLPSPDGSHITGDAVKTATDAGPAQCPECGAATLATQSFCSACGHSNREPAASASDAAEAAPQLAHAIGDITVTDDAVIHTPLGDAPLHGSVWSLSEQVTDRQYIAQSTIIWAIVLSLFCGLGLLLLLKKEHEVTGTAEVTVVSGQLQYRTTINISDRSGLDRVRADVAELQNQASLS